MLIIALILFDSLVMLLLKLDVMFELHLIFYLKKYFSRISRAVTLNC